MLYHAAGIEMEILFDFSSKRLEWIARFSCPKNFIITNLNKIVKRNCLYLLSKKIKQLKYGSLEKLSNSQRK
jgi:hypothetical protein